MLLLHRFREFVIQHALLAARAPVVVGVSGGVDSVVLLYLLREAGFEPVAAHVNYGLRGEDADADEALVRMLCDQWDVRLEVRHAEIEGSVQAAARDLRYAFFGDVAAEVGATAVATAHHRDDQAETVLLNLLRGAGPVGLAGMPLRRSLAPGSEVEVVRPLLWAPRSAIEDYARAHDLEWREDASNRSSAYRRNVLRHDVMPLLERYFGDSVSDHIAGAAELLREAIDHGAALAPLDLFEDAAQEVDGGWALRLDVLRAHSGSVQRGLLLEALRWWAPDAPRSAATVREVESLIEAQPGRRIGWTGVTIWRERDRIVFETDPAADTFELEVQPSETVTSFGTLRVDLLSEVPEAFDASPCVEYVDADRLGFPLMLRPWQVGDVFQPFGMGGHKKVSDLLTERRVPSHRRARQLVLAADEEIVWVVGHRLGARFSTGPETQRVARLTWTPALALGGSGA